MAAQLKYPHGEGIKFVVFFPAKVLTRAEGDGKI